MAMDKKVKNAIALGTLCSVAYLAVYVARNVLGAVSAAMTDSGDFLESYIGDLLFAYYMCYAVGQLINGFIGDKIKARYMISCGLLFAGVTNLVFSRIAFNGSAWAMVAYGATGFFLAMIYGPMTKVVSENTELRYATRCSLGYTFASFFGSPLAGLLATFFVWQTVFTVSSVALFVMAVICFSAFLLMEKKGIVKYGQYDKVKHTQSGVIRMLLKRQIIKFCLIAVITGVIRTALISFLTEYFADHLGFGDKATVVFSAVTLVISGATFVGIGVYECLHRNMDLTILIMFSLASCFFLGVYLVSSPWVNVVLLVLAIMASNSAATMLWSRYCPSLRDTGMVSGITGFLDFLNYMAAALASTFIGRAITGIGWNNLILILMGLMICGVVVALPYDKMLGRKAPEENT